MAGTTAELGNRLAQLGRIVLGQAPAQAALAPQSLPALLVEWSPTTGPMGAAVWEDITSAVISFTTSRGRNREMDRVEAGTMSLTLLNDDRRFDPTNTSGSYAGQLVPMKRIRIRANWAGTIYPVFMGYVEKWSTPAWRWGRMICTVTAADGFRLLAQKKISGSFPQQRTDERIAAVLAAAGWSTGQAWLLADAVYGVLGTTTIPAPVGSQSLSTGQTTVQAQTLANVSALAHIQLMAQAENSVVAISPDGAVVFQSRHQRVYPHPVDVIFGTDPNAHELPYRDVKLDTSDDSLYNEVRIARTGGVEQVAVDAPSIAAYFGHTYSVTNLPLVTDVEALSYAQWVLMRSKDYKVRLSSLIIEPFADPSGIWPHALGRDLSDRVRVIHRPPVGAVIDETCYLEGVDHDFSGAVGAGPWTTSWRLSPANLEGAWILGTSVLGVDTRPSY